MIMQKCCWFNFRESPSRDDTVDRLEDTEEIGIIWARHYPKRTENASSKVLCLTLAMIVKQRAKSLVQYYDWSDKLQHALAAARIPKEEFDTLEKETKSS